MTKKLQLGWLESIALTGYHEVTLDEKKRDATIIGGGNFFDIYNRKDGTYAYKRFSGLSSR